MALSTYTYEQLGLETGMEHLTEKEKAALENSWGAAFAEKIFPQIDEMLFVPLYSTRRSRRNVPVNVLVGAMILQDLRGMSDEELIEAAMFDLRMRTALHITNAVGKPLSHATLRRFRARLRRHLSATGEDLLTVCFRGMADSLAAFIQKYGRGTPYFAEVHRTSTVSRALAAALSAGIMDREVFRREIVEDPEVFQENCLPAHSDHIIFANEAEWLAGRRDPAGTAGHSRFRYSLNGLWYFSFAEREEDAVPDFEKLSFDCHGWPGFRVPARPRMEDYDIPAGVSYRYPRDGAEDIIPWEIPQQLNPTASCVKYFQIPQHMQGRPLFISFQGVDSGFALWLNGHYVGYSEKCFTPSEFYLTPFVQEGGNKLAVRVFGRTASSRPGEGDFYSFSGIFRDVYLYTVPAAHLYDLQIRSTPDETYRNGCLEVEACIRLEKNIGEAPAENTLFLQYELQKEGERILAGEVSAAEVTAADMPAPEMASAAGDPDPEQAPAEKTGDGLLPADMPEMLHVTFSCVVEKPLLWSAEDPQLYDLVLQLIRRPSGRGTDETGTERQAGGELLEYVRERVGFRRLEIKDGSMCINGKRIVYRSVDRPAFACDGGCAEPAELTRQDLVLMKRNNINAVRACHYPNAAALCRYCDELGLYLIAENSMEAPGSPAPAAAGPDRPGVVPGNGMEMPGSPAPAVAGPDRPGVVPENSMEATGSPAPVEAGRERPGIAPGNGMEAGTRRLCAGRMQEVKYNYQPVRILVQSDAVRICNDNLFTGTGAYDCVVILEREGEKLVEAPLRTDVPPLSEKTYTLPAAIREMIGAFLKKEETAAGKTASARSADFQEITADPAERMPAGSCAEYCITVSMRLKEDCAWAERGYEIAFGQGVFSACGGKTAAESAETFAGSENANDISDRQEAEDSSVQEKTEDITALEITGSDRRRPVSIKTAGGALELTRGSFHIGIRGEYFDALFSLRKGGLVSFRRGGRGAIGCNTPGAGPAFGGRASFRAGAFAGRGELFEKMPRPCFWRAPAGSEEGCRMAARYGIWKLADTCLIPRPDTLRIVREKESVLLQMRHDLPVLLPAAGPCGTKISGETGDLPESADKNPPDREPGSVTVGYRFFADGKLTMTMDWDPPAQDSLPPMPVFGFMFRLHADLDRFTYYGNGPAENYADCCRGARLGIFKETVRGNMSPCPIPQECGNRTGVRWAEVTDACGRGVRFTANTEAPGTAQTQESRTRVPQHDAMEFSALPWTPQQLEEAEHVCELPSVHFTNVRCALMQTGIDGDDSRGTQIRPQYCLLTDRKLRFSVTVEAV